MWGTRVAVALALWAICEVSVAATDCEAAPQARISWQACDKHRVFLRGVDLSQADLRKAVLAGTDLQHAKLPGADLRDADLRWANLQFVDLRGATIEGARFDGATWLDGTLCAAGSIGKCVPRPATIGGAEASSVGALTGRWYMEAETHEVEVIPCHAPGSEPVLCVRLIRAGWNRTTEDRDILNPDIGLKDRRVNGLLMSTDLVQGADGAWAGHIYNPGKGRSFDARIEVLGPRELRLRYFFREDGHQNKHDRRWFREGE